MQNQAAFDRLGAISAARLEALRANLRTTTIAPDSSFGGQVVYELPKTLRKPKQAAAVRIVVTIAGDTHTFNGVVEKMPK